MPSRRESNGKSQSRRRAHGSGNAEAVARPEVLFDSGVVRLVRRDGRRGVAFEMTVPEGECVDFATKSLTAIADVISLRASRPRTGGEYGEVAAWGSN